jgi:protein phosphatase
VGYDVLSDVHGCFDEFGDLLERLGWTRSGRDDDPWRPPDGRHLVVAGDVVDRGPKIVELLRVVMAMTAAGTCTTTVGNHDDKLMRALAGRPVKVSHGLEASLEQLEAESAAFRAAVRAFIASLAAHVVLDEGALVVAHAGLPEHLHGKDTPRARDFALYGATAKGQDEWGLPLRLDWTATYRGSAAVVYGHTPVVEPVWRNNTIDIDTGCVFGSRLSALRWPEREIVSVPARKAYREKGGPFRVGGPGGPPADDVPIRAAG